MDPSHDRPQPFLADDTPETTDQRRVLALFRKRLAAGNYDALIGQGLRRTLRGAAADPGLEAEIGALRLTLIRLLNEESDPSRLAAGVSRIAAVAVQAARLRNAPDADLETIRNLLLREIDAVEQEYANELAQGKECARHDRN